MILIVDTISIVSLALKVRIRASLNNNNNNNTYAAYLKSHSKEGFLTSVHFLQKHKSICQGKLYYKILHGMASKKLLEK